MTGTKSKSRTSSRRSTGATGSIINLAFGTVDVPRLICLDPGNPASMRVAGRAGFVLDGQVAVDDHVFPLLSLTRSAGRPQPAFDPAVDRI